MNVTISVLEDIVVTGAIRLVDSAATDIGLYMAENASVVRMEAPFYDHETKLTSIAVDGLTQLKPDTISLPQPLPVSPAWDVVLDGKGGGAVVSTLYGGAWNTLQVDKIADGKLAPDYSYEIEATDRPSFVINTSATEAKKSYVTAIFSGYQLGIIGLQEQDGAMVPAVSGLVGSSDAPVSRGRVWGDLSKGVPSTVSLIYQEDKNIGPLTPSGAFSGSLLFNIFDTVNNTLGTSVSLLPEVDFSEMDVAISGDYFCVFAVTGDGAPLLALYDSTGTPEGSPYIPAGSWSNAGRWVTNPTITATPGAEAAFSFAFIEMNGSAPSGMYSGTLTIPPTP